LPHHGRSSGRSTRRLEWGPALMEANIFCLIRGAKTRQLGAHFFVLVRSLDTTGGPSRHPRDTCQLEPPGWLPLHPPAARLTTRNQVTSVQFLSVPKALNQGTIFGTLCLVSRDPPPRFLRGPHVGLSPPPCPPRWLCLF